MSKRIAYLSLSLLLLFELLLFCFDRSKGLSLSLALLPRRLVGFWTERSLVVVPLLAWRLLDNGVLQTARVSRIPFFFMPLTGTDSVAGGASTTTELDMFVVLRKPER